MPLLDQYSLIAVFKKSGWYLFFSMGKIIRKSFGLRPLISTSFLYAFIIGIAHFDNLFGYAGQTSINFRHILLSVRISLRSMVGKLNFSNGTTEFTKFRKTGFLNRRHTLVGESKTTLMDGLTTFCRYSKAFSEYEIDCSKSPTTYKSQLNVVAILRSDFA